MPGILTHKWRPIQFTLVINNFGVKYVGKEHAEHLISALQEYYTIPYDWKGEIYVGITLYWDHQNNQVHLSMPGYVKSALQRFNHPIPTRRQDLTFLHTPPDYGAKIQNTKEPDTAEILNEEGNKFIHQVSGTLLYLVRDVDITLLTPLSAITSQQSKSTAKTMNRTLQILDYFDTQEEAVLTYSGS